MTYSLPTTVKRLKRAQKTLRSCHQQDRKRLTRLTLLLLVCWKSEGNSWPEIMISCREARTISRKLDQRWSLLVLRRKPRITLRVDDRLMNTVSQFGTREGSTGTTSSSEDLGADQNATTSEYDWIWLYGYFRYLLLIYPVWKLIIRLRRKKLYMYT